MCGDLVGSGGGMGTVATAAGAVGVVSTTATVVIVVATWNGLLAIVGVTGWVPMKLVIGISGMVIIVAIGAVEWRSISSWTRARIMTNGHGCSLRIWTKLRSNLSELAVHDDDEEAGEEIRSYVLAPRQNTLVDGNTRTRRHLFLF
ncbi:hypothetical protein L3X38_013359 [Prunus dulcis]|uniref:Transmembrane protein n=1 Tax=Prunus dulcis TaxID=3755 RepID=A0AAD4WNU1_PRUDU|nr:hypothetical protein L3X38_013359 [Prunus dulcis]